MLQYIHTHRTKQLDTKEGSTGGNGKPDDFTKVSKRTEWTSEYAYNFYGFCLKNYGVESYVFREKGKSSSQANYDNTLVKLNIINKTIIFSDSCKNWKFLGFQ